LLYHTHVYYLICSYFKWEDFILQNELTANHIPTIFTKNANQYSNSVT
jgi:hypothetical protein